MELNEKELYEVSGGVNWGLIAAFGSAIVFFIGLFSGITNPTKCNN